MSMHCEPVSAQATVVGTHTTGFSGTTPETVASLMHQAIRASFTAMRRRQSDEQTLTFHGAH